MSQETNNKVKLTIDDQEVIVNKGTLLIEAAKGVGAEVPHFCYHQKLKPDANCRMCLVAIEKMPKLQTACSTPATEGMIVHTKTPPVLEAHKTVLDFILANHPLDCPVCDQGGRCDLQNYSHEYTAYGRYAETKRVYDKEFFSPLIEKEMNRCVTCLRCVRYCDEIIDSKALAPFNRGTMTEIGHLGDRQLECEFCGGCVQICPVGAFTNRLSMYDFRPWMMKKTQTVCNYCGDGCTLALETREREVIEVASFDVEFKELRGRNEGDLCAKGYFGFQFVNSPNRLTMPLVLKGDQLVESSWEEALDAVATNFRRIKTDHGGKAFGGLMTARATNENLFAFQKFMRTVIGTNHIDSTVRLGHINAALAMTEVQGTNRWGASYEDIVQADAVLLIGTHITEANPIVGLKVKAAARKNGADLIVALPHARHVSTMSNIVNHATHHLRLTPGSEGALILGLTKAVIEENLVDPGLARKGEDYVTRIRQAVSGLSAADLEAVTGVPYDLIKKAAAAWAKAVRGVVLFGEGVVRGNEGYHRALNLLDLAMLTGKLAKEGCGVGVLCEENNEQGAFEMGVVPDLLPGGRPVADEALRSEVGNIWREDLPAEPGASLMDQLELARQGQIKALYLVGENPVGTLPASSMAREAIEKAEFVVSQDLFLTETGRLSDVVLPAASFAEQSGHFTNNEGRVQIVRQAFDPIRDTRPDWEIFSQIASFMGMYFEYGGEDEISTEIQKIVPNWKALPPIEDRQSAVDRYQSRAPSVPLEARYRLNGGGQAKGDGGFMLAMGPTLFHSGKMSLQAEGLRKIVDRGLLRMSPVDAARLGIEEGGQVKLRTSAGEALVGVKIDGRYSPGYVFFPESFNDPGVKDLMHLEVDSVTRVPYFKMAEVQIEKWSS
jgi:NADH-quinone oxidoreductase chain G